MPNILNQLILLYGSSAEDVHHKVTRFISEHQPAVPKRWVTEDDIVLITYGDSIKNKDEKPLHTLNTFLNAYVKQKINIIHLLPMFPYTSDDGFSVTDYRSINPDLGTWAHIKNLSTHYDLMFDAVINHISVSSRWFQGFLQGDEAYADYFIECDDTLDYSAVTRPRALPLYYPYKTKTGRKNIWATFSEDQVDLNFKNPKVLLEILDILVLYANKGARLIRLDAIGFIWKKLGTACMHLAETHALIQIIRAVIEACVPGTILISETNVPHKENISYLGNGFDEAHMVYQFPLPPLTLFSFLVGRATKLTRWAKSLEDTPLSPKTAYFNFLASHDGIGLRPVDDILNDKEKEIIRANVLTNGGRISYKNNQDGSQTPYELNINYQDAIYIRGDSDETRIRKFLAAQSILLTVIGVPGIYVHSLLGSRNDDEGVKSTNIPRRINREKLQYDTLVSELEAGSDRTIIFSGFLKMIDLRKSQSAFSPAAEQKVLAMDERLFAYIRKNNRTNESILVITNVSSEVVLINIGDRTVDIITGRCHEGELRIEPFQYLWLKIQ